MAVAEPIGKVATIGSGLNYMKVILLADSHGDIDRINRLAAQYDADACIHCGDVSFFDHESIRHLPVEELAKIVRHAPVPAEEKSRITALPHAEQAENILQLGVAGTFEDYLNGKKTFEIPVYAVWGNHEDIRIVNRLREEPLPNLTLLDERRSVMLEKVRIYGIGGDFNEKHLPMAEKLGIPWVKNQIRSAFWQYHKLVKMLDEFPHGEVRLQVTHCDPAENRFLEALAHRGGASLTLSGHMHRKESRMWCSYGNTEEVFRHYQAMFPELPWKRMAGRQSNAGVQHLNLSPGKVQFLEINGEEYYIKP